MTSPPAAANTICGCWRAEAGHRAHGLVEHLPPGRAIEGDNRICSLVGQPDQRAGDDRGTRCPRSRRPDHRERAVVDRQCSQLTRAGDEDDVAVMGHTAEHATSRQKRPRQGTFRAKPHVSESPLHVEAHLVNEFADPDSSVAVHPCDQGPASAGGWIERESRPRAARKSGRQDALLHTAARGGAPAGALLPLFFRPCPQTAARPSLNGSSWDRTRNQAGH
jgi:hypothetical protein